MLTYLFCLVNALAGFVQLSYALLYLQDTSNENMHKIFLSIFLLLINAIFYLAFFLSYSGKRACLPSSQAKPSRPNALNVSINVELRMSLGNENLNSRKDLTRPINSTLIKTIQPIPQTSSSSSGKVKFIDSIHFSLSSSRRQSELLVLRRCLVALRL